jgi:hypothetical protein
MNGGLEVADVFRDGESQFLSQYEHTLSGEQWKVFRAVTRCRTAALGGHMHKCHDCGHQQIQYNSCRNRHCPKCQAMARAAWLDQRERELLPIPYFHVVFTLPHELAPLALQNKREVYDILFRAAAETLQTVAADPKHLGANVGCLMVLHTWGQNLMHHPHVHAIVTGGGLSADGSRWISSRKPGRKDFFAPVRILSRVFRGKFMAYLKQAFSAGMLAFYGDLKPLCTSVAFERHLNTAVRQDWVVYAKRPFGGPKQVLRYLARYTHRVAISNQRLITLEDGKVSFGYKDYADEQRSKVMTLSTSEFMRRFLMHTLPSAFVRIRYYGFLANRHRNERLNLCRTLLGQPFPMENVAAETPSETEAPQLIKPCPKCGSQKVVYVELLPVRSASAAPRPHFLIRSPEKSFRCDSS